jgi:hypothetical protein
MTPAFFCFLRRKGIFHRIDYVGIRLIGFRTEGILIRVPRLRIERWELRFWF